MVMVCLFSGPFPQLQQSALRQGTLHRAWSREVATGCCQMKTHQQLTYRQQILRTYCVPCRFSNDNAPVLMSLPCVGKHNQQICNIKRTSLSNKKVMEVLECKNCSEKASMPR